MKKHYSTTLFITTIKKLKIQSAKENRTANLIIEDALKSYFAKSNIKKEKEKEKENLSE